jgi:hypothetical protein
VRLITRGDDELYGLISTAGKFGRAAKILAMLERERDASPADVEAVGRHALALMAALPSMTRNLGAHASFTDAIESFGDVLALDPDHWLARYGRARLRTLVPSSYGSYSVQTDGVLAAAREDLRYLIGLQARLPPQPYFASTHAAALLVDRLAGAQDPDALARLTEVLRGCRLEPVRLPALGAVLCEPLATLHASGGGAPEREAIGTALTTLYGDQTAAAVVRRVVARR